MVVQLTQLGMYSVYRSQYQGQMDSVVQIEAFLSEANASELIESLEKLLFPLHWFVFNEDTNSVIINIKLHVRKELTEYHKSLFVIVIDVYNIKVQV